MSEHKSAKSTEGIVTSDAEWGRAHPSRFRKFAKSKKRTALVVIVILMVLVGGCLLYQHFHKKPLVIQTSLTTAQQEQVPTNDYAGMTVPEVKYAMQLATQRSLQDLQTKPVDGKLLTSFDAALAAGRGYYELGECARSMQAYAVAASKTSAADATFYIEYGNFASICGQASIAKAQLGKANAALAQGLVPSDQKTSIQQKTTALAGTISRRKQ